MASTNHREPGSAARPVSLRPFLKWAGGKRQLAARLAELLPLHYERYLEPFLGSGALFFHLRPACAILNDANRELVDAWLAVRDRLPDLEQCLARHRAAHGREHYYRVRAIDPGMLDPLERAARFLYLNKTCFNGLYRVNSRGRFNVPMGRYTRPSIPSAATLAAHAEALRGVEIVHGPYDAFCRERAQAGDLVYFDPPYDPVSATANFTAYSAGGFGPEDQERLRDLFAELDERGCLLVLSNADTPFVRKLYARWAANSVAVTARRAINSRASARGAVGEIVVRNFDRT